MQEPASPARKWERVVIAMILIVLAIRAAVVPLFAISMRNYPLDYVMSEGDHLVYLHQMLEGGPIYSDSTQFPMFGNIYPPVYPVINWLAAQIFAPSMAMLRMVSLLPLVGVMSLVGLFLYKARVPMCLVIAGMLLVPAGFSVGQYLIYVRSDGWMTLFSFASLYFLQNVLRAGEEQPSRSSFVKPAIWGAFFVSLALFTKQTALFGAAAVALHLLIARPRPGLIVGALIAGFCTVLLALSLWRFGPVLMDSLLHLTVRRVFDSSRLVHLAVPEIAAIAVLAGIVLARMAAHLAGRSWDLLDTYVLGHFASFWLILFDLSGANYLLPTYPGLIVAAVLSVNDLLKAGILRAPLILGGAGLVGLHLLLQLPFAGVFEKPSPAEMAEADLAARFLQGTDEPVYAERFWTPIAQRADCRRFFCEPTHIRTLPPGRLNVDVFEEPFRKKRFARMLVYLNGYHSEGFAEMVTKYYQVVRRGTVKVCFSYPAPAEIVYLERKPDSPQR